MNTNDLKNSPEEFNSRLDQLKESIANSKIGHLKYPVRGIKRKRNKKSEAGLKTLWYFIKQTNSHSIGVPEGEKRKKGRNEMDFKIQEFKSFNKDNPKRPILICIITKLSKI